MASAKVYIKSCASMEEVEDNSIQFAMTSFPDVFKPGPDSGGSKDLSRTWLSNRTSVIDQALAFLPRLLVELSRVMKDDGVFILNAGSAVRSADNASFSVLLPLIYAEHIVQTSDFRLLRDFLMVQVRNKDGEVVASEEEFRRGIASVHQHLLLFSKSDRPKVVSESIIPSVWMYRSTKPEAGAPTAFDVGIVRNLITFFTTEGDSVLDPLAGTGTLGAIATRMERNSIMYEIDPKLIPVIRASFARLNVECEILP